MNLSIFKTRFILYLIILTVISWFLFNYLLNLQNNVMYQYFIEKPASYNLERAERLASSIYKSFKKEVQNPSPENIEKFIEKYNDIPFLSVNFVYQEKDGTIKSILEDVKELDILSAEYVYPIRYNNQETGTLLIYDINKEYKRGLKEYNDTIIITKLFFTILLSLLFFIIVFREYNAKITGQKRIAEYQAIHDGLTGLFNQKHFKETLKRELSRSERHGRPISLIMCDVDFFKKFNDTYGHLAGDDALQQVSNIISQNVREYDLVARYGGEEFAILLMETSVKEVKNIAKRVQGLTDEALEIANRIKNNVQNTLFEINGAQTNITISMGIASYDGKSDYKPEYLINSADIALYESKNTGRNKITFFNSETKQFENFS
jgi:GGDEF domain-containing protein